MKQHILTFLLLFSIALIGQNAAVNSAKAKKEAIVLFETYEQKSEEFHQNHKYDSVKVYLGKLDALLPQIKDSSYTYRADLIRGSVLTRNTQSDKAMNVLLKAVEFFKLQEDYPNYYRGRYKMGICYYYVNRRGEAKKMMLEVLENTQYVTEDLATSALANIASINIELGAEPKDTLLLNDAIRKLNSANLVNRKNKNYTKLASNYSLLAESYNQLEDKQKAIQLLDSAIYFAQKNENLVEEGFALIKKANLLTKNKQYVPAKKMFNKAIKIYTGGEYNPLLLYAYREKWNMFVLKENFKAATSLGDSINKLSIINYNKRFADGISEAEIKYKTAEKEREIFVNRVDLAEKELLLQKRQFQIYGALGLALIFCILGYLFYNQQKLKNRQLVKENKLKVALREIETQNKLQEQRLRISRDLHDNIGAQLSFIISSIDNLKYASKETSTEFKDKLAYISEFTLATIDQLRDTIWAMNKDEISITDLQSRVLAFIEKAKVAKQNIKFEFDNGVTSPILFSAIEGMHLFRVVQESINNSLKYAEATLIKVHFNEVDNQLILSVKDNGIGFEKETVQLGNGLYNMQKRMDEINANIDIQSELQKGTTITVKVQMINAKF
ncbi:Oxygen sensor histidine kinase NreB [Kordia antarctica]|uniref:histidine kinase n=1 Tax=Kordia antarctica TaxID=1218801 RepID=A0A7L4ZK04_9FLAO|nr:sensor histidine kinase [Kordia antarctica]QHI36841.1 Oxygen sensor histidine kinase NreB [Kordia antarctica]